MFNNSVFLKHGICDTVTVFLTLLPSLWTQEWAIGKGLCLLAQTNLQLLNASVQDCTWHCALRTVTFQKRISLKRVGLWSSVWSHLALGSMRAQQRWVLVTARDGCSGPPRVSPCAPALGAGALSVEAELGGSFGDVDGAGGSHPLLFTKERYWKFIIESCCSLQLVLIYF